MSKLIFAQGTPVAVINALTYAYESGARIRLFYGDTEMGYDWLEENDVVGTVGVSTGEQPIPLLVPKGQCGGGGILTLSIVKIQNVETGRIMYEHARYNQPEFSTHEYKGGWEVRDHYGVVHARYPSKRGATRWMNFITGVRSTR